MLHAQNPVPDDTFASGKDISITNGYFYCQVAAVDNCVGGGGGGGGEPPVF
ncbi:MAG: hypothetical protein IPM57_00605 [Oligoflexia bacterium]|nr:hypothetical protein [Oligoflexia bacterium]